MWLRTTETDFLVLYNEGQRHRFYLVLFLANLETIVKIFSQVNHDTQYLQYRCSEMVFPALSGTLVEEFG